MTPPSKAGLQAEVQETPPLPDSREIPNTNPLVLEPGTYRTCHPTGKRTLPAVPLETLPDEMIDDLMKEADELFGRHRQTKRD